MRHPIQFSAFPVHTVGLLFSRSRALFQALFGWAASWAAAAGVSLALGFGLGGCSADRNSGPIVVDLQDKTYPTGIDHWPAKSTVVFSDFGGSIYSIQEDGTRIARLMDIKVIDCARVLRLRIDEVHNRLWIMSASGICVYELQSLQLIRHLPIGDMSNYRLANGLTDIALDSRGNAYAIDTGVDPIVYRIESTTFTATVWNKVMPPHDASVYSARHFPLNAVAVTPQDRHLLYVNAYTGILHAIDIASGQHSTVFTSHRLHMVNALIATPSATNPDGIDLYAISAGNNSITIVGLDGNMKTARARIHATKYLDNPLAGAWVRGLLFVTNSGLLRHPEIGGDRGRPRSFSIVRLGSGYFANQAVNLVMDSVLGP